MNICGPAPRSVAKLHLSSQPLAPGPHQSSQALHLDAWQPGTGRGGGLQPMNISIFGWFCNPVTHQSPPPGSTKFIQVPFPTCRCQSCTLCRAHPCSLFASRASPCTVAEHRWPAPMAKGHTASGLLATAVKRCPGYYPSERQPERASKIEAERGRERETPNQRSLIPYKPSR